MQLGCEVISRTIFFFFFFLVYVTGGDFTRGDGTGGRQP